MTSQEASIVFQRLTAAGLQAEIDADDDFEFEVAQGQPARLAGNYYVTVRAGEWTETSVGALKALHGLDYRLRFTYNGLTVDR